MNIQEITEHINSNSWTKLGHWQSTVVINESSSRALLGGYEAPLGFEKRIETLGVNDDFFLLASDHEFISNFFYTEIKKNVGYLDKLADILDQLSWEVLENIEKVADIESLFAELRKVESPGIIIVPLDAAIEKYLTETGYDPAILAQVYPIRRAYMIQERVDFLTMKLDEAAGKDIQERLTEHANQYGWMKNVNWRTQGYNVEYYKGMLDNISLDKAKSELEALNNSDQVQIAIDKFLGEHDEKHVQILPYLRKLLDAKMLNWDVVGIAQRKWRNLLAQNEFLSQLSYESVTRLTSVEIVKTAAGELLLEQAQSLAESRSHDRILCSQGDEIYVLGVRPQDLDQLSLYSVDKETKLISGTVAYKGSAYGPVTVVHGSGEISLVKEGDILVCPMTNPDLMPAIIKSKALITDEGGLLCHAAIVARELKKPCIIGTKNATKVLKDGDLVEVDAEKGIVKILN